MRRLIQIIFIFVLCLLLLSGCKKDPNVTFLAEIEQVSENSLLVRTEDDVSFDEASVGFDKNLSFNKNDYSVGEKVKITILPEIRESYPVQVTAVSIEPAEASK